MKGSVLRRREGEIEFFRASPTDRIDQELSHRRGTWPGRSTPIHGLYKYVPSDRAGFFRVSVIK